MSALTPHPGEASPFDAIRQTREDGSEFWSARDLMVAVGYDRWRNFENAIDKARAAAENQGHAAGDHFADVSKVIPGGRWGEQTVDDFHLSRFAAYLVMMNGDPRKPEIAAAQAYFAIRTREAEVAQPEPMDELEIAERYLASVRERRALAEKVAADAPLVAQAETFRQADGLRTIPDLANDLKTNAATNYPGARVLHQDVFDLAGQCGVIVRGNTVRHNQPTARAVEAGWALPKENVYEDSKGIRHVKIGARLTPRGYGRVWDAAVKNLREHGTVLAPRKEISR